MKLQSVLAIVLLFLFSSFTPHKYYVSLCEIEYVEKEASIQIILGLFIDDIELTLEKDLDIKMNLCSDDEIDNADKHFENYLNSNFKIIANQKQENYNYIGKEYDDDIIRFYLEVTNINVLKSLEIQNTCLLRDFTDQKNIIKIKVKNLHKTYYLDNKNANCLLKI